MRNKLITIIVFIFTSVSFITGCSQAGEQPESQANTKVTQTEPVASESRTIIKEFDTNNIFGLKGIYTEDNAITFSYDIDASQAYSEDTYIDLYSCLINNDDFYITLGTQDGTTYLIRDFEVYEDNDYISITLIPQVNISFNDIAWINVNDYMIITDSYRLVYSHLSGEEETQYNQSYNKATDSWRPMETSITVLEE